MLDQIDEFLDAQKENEAKVFFVLPILLFGFLSWYFIYPITDGNLKNTISKNSELHKNIKDAKKDINDFNKKNIQLRKNISELKIDLKKLHKNKIKYDELVKKLKFLRFNLVEWAKFYNNISILSKKHNIYIYQLDNVMDNTKIDKLIQKKMTITIQANGNFVNFVKFMVEFEKLKEFVKITSIEMTADDMKLTIDIYGAQL